MEEDSRRESTARVQNLKSDSTSNKNPKKRNTNNKSGHKVMAKKARGGSRISARQVGHSFLDNFKNEWSLFWAGLLGDDSASALPPEVVENLSSGQIKEITKALSEQKKILNQRLESLAKEIDLNAGKLQSFKLAGVESLDTEKRLNELTDLGQEITTELSKLDERLRNVRGQERAAAKLAAVL